MPITNGQCGPQKTTLKGTWPHSARAGLSVWWHSLANSFPIKAYAFSTFLSVNQRKKDLQCVIYNLIKIFMSQFNSTELYLPSKTSGAGFLKKHHAIKLQQYFLYKNSSVPIYVFCFADMLCRPVNTTYNNLSHGCSKLSLSSGDVQKILIFGMKENTRRLCTNIKKLGL